MLWHTFRDRLATANDSSVGKELLDGQLGGGINNLYGSKHVLAKERLTKYSTSCINWISFIWFYVNYFINRALQFRQSSFVSGITWCPASPAQAAAQGQDGGQADGPVLMQFSVQLYCLGLPDQNSHHSQQAPTQRSLQALRSPITV